MELLQSLKETITKKIGKKEQIESDIVSLEKEVKRAKKDLVNFEEAREIINIVGLNTQKKLQFHISDITSLAMESVFPDPYKVLLEFIEKRNKTECSIQFERDGNLQDPLDGGGHGAANVAAFALRIAAYSLQHPKPRNVMMLDEPFKDLSPAFHEPASEMVKQISKKLGIQFIIVSHKPEFAAHADRTFKTKIKKGITKIITS